MRPSQRIVAAVVLFAVLESRCSSGTRGMRATWSDGRYHISWEQSDYRFVRVIRLDRHGQIESVDPAGPFERQTAPGHYSVSLPSTDMPDVILLLSIEPLGGDVTTYALHCPHILDAWAAEPVEAIARDADGGTTATATPDGGVAGRRYRSVDNTQRRLWIGLLGGQTIRDRGDNPCLALRVTFPR